MVTPFEQDSRDLAIVSVAMRDEPGAVRRLVAAIATLGINIDIQESSSINLLDHHFVALIVDLSGCSTSTRAGFSSPASTSTSPTAVQRLYRDYGSLFPVRDLRFVELFEAIVAHCLDFIVWKEISGEYLPDIDIRPYPERRLEKLRVGEVLASGQPFHVSIDLPIEIAGRLESVADQGGRLEYLLMSDTSTRALHAFFLHPDVTPKLFHVAFFHDDTPGALATILALVHTAKFNILTSLIRKEKEGSGVWEAVLEYQGPKPLPNGHRTACAPIGQDDLKWIAEVICDAHRRDGDSNTVRKRKILVGSPKYPKRPEKEIWLEDISLDDLGATISRNDPPSKSEREPDVSSVARRRQDVKKRQGEGKLHQALAFKGLQLLDLIEARANDGERPRIFLSCPTTATQKGEEIAKRLQEQYNVERFTEPNGEVIVEEVIRKIEGCDYFIGIWHHDRELEGADEKTHNLSPWMVFEYGIARATGKPTLVAHSDKLHEEIWKRIEPGVANIGYTEKGFKSETLQMIWEYCQRHFH